MILVSSVECKFGVNDIEIISVDGSNLIFKAFRYENLYLVDFNASETQLSTCLLTKSSMGWLWHRLGNVGMKQLNKLIKHNLVRGLKDVTFEKDKLCGAYQARKRVGNTHPKKSIMSTSKAFELLHMDLFRPTSYNSIGGNKYGFVVVNDFIGYTWVVFLVDKSDVFATFKSFVKRIHNEFETSIKRVRIENGSEFKNTRIDELCDGFGVRYQFLAKYTLQSNNLVERKNRTLIDMAWSMLSEYNVSHSFCHPMLVKTPYEILNGRKPNIAYF